MYPTYRTSSLVGSLGLHNLFFGGVAQQSSRCMSSIPAVDIAERLVNGILTMA